MKYLDGTPEESAKNVPLLFVASPSAKDSTWEERSPGTHTHTHIRYNAVVLILKLISCMSFIVKLESEAYRKSFADSGAVSGLLWGFVVQFK